MGSPRSAPAAWRSGCTGPARLGTVLLTPLSAGALRIGDWVAHWFLVLVYLGQPPGPPHVRQPRRRLRGDLGPPLYNLEGGLLVGALDDQFWPFQLVTPLLALPVVAAGVLWGQGDRRGRPAWIMAALLGLSPFLLQNGVYPWSKMVAAGWCAVLAADPRRRAGPSADSRAADVRAGGPLRWPGLPGSPDHDLLRPAHAPLARVAPAWPLFRRPLGWTLLTWALGGLAGLAAFAPGRVGCWRRTACAPPWTRTLPRSART